MDHAGLIIKYMYSLRQCLSTSSRKIQFNFEVKTHQVAEMYMLMEDPKLLNNKIVQDDCVSKWSSCRGPCLELPFPLWFDCFKSVFILKISY